MRKAMLLAVFAGLWLSSAAQWSWGIKAGTNVSAISNSSLPEYLDLTRRMKTGFYGGLLVQYHFSDVVSIQPELCYSRQGQSYTGTNTVGQTEYNMVYRKRMSYLTLPVMLRLHPSRSLSIDLGPQFGLLVDASGYEKLLYREDGLSGSTEQTIDLLAKGKHKNVRIARQAGEYYKDLDYGVAVGVTVQAMMNFSFSARYYCGLTDCVKNLDGKNTNQVIQLGVQVRF